MKRTRSRFLLWWCLIIAGLVLLIIGHNSYAQSANDAAAASPYWRDVAMAAGGIVMFLIGFWLRSSDKRIAAAEAAGQSTRELLLGEYPSKSEMREVMQDALAPVSAQLEALREQMRDIRRRLDERN